eukprot:CAMPEP_0206258630 /NCGR_PEP_ID=MMETSP0047_2-20121206/26035_1 /ASSEMBLY_ACC=CAM_ASM_000192 /TAXON_ID=195065 /ORGANISM="Chroomonas mesostigmatica_cf, Strain CCMP1168" /LENGTH=302 /DNA_ID=CAMNT_0053685413 /DNA_START=74 /DNA_END=982 /DNA_ORIENTATION=+
MKHAVHTVFKETVEAVMPVSNVSQFRDKGVLTPEEFVAAGDLLVAKCPSWSWQAGEASKAKEYLPKDKQYLVTRNVPCYRRVADQSSSVTESKMMDAEDSEWTETVAVSSGGGGMGMVEDLDDEDGAAVGSNAAAAGGAADGGGEDDMPDLDDLELEEGGIEENDASALAPQAATPASDFVRARSYTVSITYDKYYMVPRMWLFGYDEDGKPLTHEQVFQDMSQDHAKKTVTIDPHPHISGVSQASVHPCKHSLAIKRIIDQIEDSGSGKPMRPDQAMFLFLKFISSVIPTIEYDFTIDFDA